MGFQIPERMARLIFEDDYKGAEVRVKFNLPIGRVIAAQDAASSGNIKELCYVVADILVEWNLEDSDGKPIPATYEGILTLSADFLLLLVKTWAGAQVGPTAPLEAPSTVGSQSVEAELPMEALSASPAS